VTHAGATWTGGARRARRSGARTASCHLRDCFALFGARSRPRSQSQRPIGKERNALIFGYAHASAHRATALLRTTVDRLGVSDTLLGNTAIAASVEAEEVERVAVPTKRGKPEFALGNIAGTIVHFFAFNAGVIALVKPLSLDSATLDLNLPVAVASTDP
jgi:Ca2+/Na+ antiporter